MSESVDHAVEAIIWPTIGKMADFGFIDRDEGNGGVASYAVDQVGDLLHFLLDQLLSPRSVSCEECWKRPCDVCRGTAKVPWTEDERVPMCAGCYHVCAHERPCPSCDGSGVRVLPAPIDELIRDRLGEPVACRQPTSVYGHPWDYRTVSPRRLPLPGAELLFRLSDPIPSPQNAEASE